MPVDPNSKYRQRQINHNPVGNSGLLVCFAKRYFNSPATSPFNPIVMLSLFISDLSKEDEVFRFANPYPQPAPILCIAPFIAFIFDKFTFFPSSPLPMIGADTAALVKLLPHLCSCRESTSSSERFFKVILSIICKGGKPAQDHF